MPKINRVHFVLLIAKTIVYQITTSFIGEYTTERRTMKNYKFLIMKNLEQSEQQKSTVSLTLWLLMLQQHLDMQTPERQS